jgi:GAF domain-containing protein
MHNDTNNNIYPTFEQQEQAASERRIVDGVLKGMQMRSTPASRMEEMRDEERRNRQRQAHRNRDAAARKAKAGLTLAQPPATKAVKKAVKKK